MQTLYIDVYFLINFTVDILALYFAALFSKVPTSVRRLILSALLGALAAVGIILMPEKTLPKLFFSAVSLIAMASFATKRVRLVRRAKFTFSFFMFLALVGGVTYYLWDVFDKFLYEKIDGFGGVANRKLLFFSIVVLLSIGVFKMIVSFFSNIESEGNVEIEIAFGDKRLRLEAFVDSGNLAIDPMDMRPVLFIKSNVAADIFPENVISLRDPDSLDRSVRKRIRLIPISRSGATHVLTGVRVDSVSIITKDKREEIGVTVAIDKDEGSFGGYDALLPSAVVGDAIHK